MQLKKRQLTPASFAKEAKQQLKILQGGIKNLQANIEDLEKTTILYQSASGIARGATVLGMGNVQQLAQTLKDSFAVLQRSPVRADETLKSQLLRIYNTLQGLVEMQEMPEMSALSGDVEREVMAGTAPVLEQMTLHLNRLVEAQQPPERDVPEDRIGSGKDLEEDYWADPDDDAIALPALSTIEASNWANLVSGDLFRSTEDTQDIDLQGTGELDIDLLDDWNATLDSEADYASDDTFEPFEPLEDLEALFSDDAPLAEKTFDSEDTFSELETLTDLPTWLVSEEPENWTAEELPIQLATLSYYEPLDDWAESEVTAAADRASESEFDVKELAALLDRSAAEPAPIEMPAAPSAIAPKEAEPAPIETAKPAVSRGGGFEQTIKVPVRQMDNLSNLIGELVVNRNSLEQDQERLRRFLDNLLDQVQNLNDLGGRMQDLYERSLLESSLLAGRTGAENGGPPRGGSAQNNQQEYDPLEIDRFTGFHLISQEMMEMIVRVRESSSDIEFLVDEVDKGGRNLRQVTSQLQEDLTTARMVPFAQIADSFPRAVRDISHQLGKQAKLAVEGRDTLVDKMILEQLYDPLIHLINNAITHGIETPRDRQANGKPAIGQISVRAQHQGNQTLISISDDGAGIDPQRVKNKAVQKKLIGADDVELLSELEVYDFIFHPGFSTKDKADDYSGRGVGMDVVRSTLTKLRGTITIDSKIGKGTTFTVGLPLTLSIGKALCCVHEKTRIAFPMDGVEDMFDIDPAEVQSGEDGEKYLSWQNQKTKGKTDVPFKTLSELLPYNRKIGRGSLYGKREDNKISVVLLRSTGNMIAVEVEQVLGEQEIAIKQLKGPIPKPVGIAGATVLGDGSVIPIADAVELIDLFYGRIRKSALSGTLPEIVPVLEDAESDAESRVLIVDDSITVRELLSMTFTKAGYRVEQARDGQEAWEKLRAGMPCDLIFCDIDMPRMDGLELLSRLQKDKELSQIPISMLTSRGADRHRQMAHKLGARGYFTKPYLEEVLLEAAQRLREGETLL